MYSLHNLSCRVSKSFLCRSYLFMFIFSLAICGKLNGQVLSAEQIYEKVNDAVVVVLSYDYSDNLTSQGSGVVLNDKGYVVTNYHVLSGNERLEIIHGEDVIPYVDIIGIDVEKDILILKIEDKKFPAIKTGEVKSLKVGQRVYAIGSPMGFENTISEGIVSGLRSYEELRKNYIQITASISSGSSGGAVVNDKGELIGISTLTSKVGQNLNFAIPIDEVLKVEIGSYSKDDRYKDFELLNKGLNAERKGNYQEAINYYSRYIAKFPNNSFAYNNRGAAKFNIKDYIGAIKDYNKAIEINPNHAFAYTNRGAAKGTVEDHRGAIQDFDRAIEINPNLAQAYYNRGLNKAILGDKSGACLDWSKADELGYDKAYSVIRKYCK